MKKYKLIENGVKDIENNIIIPEESNNRDWKEYLKWLDDGNSPDPILDQEIIDKNSLEIRGDRDMKINDIIWRVERYFSETRQGISLTDNIQDLDGYIQDLRDITSLPGFPWNGVEDCPWPEKP